MKRLPNTIYVKEEQDGDSSFLIADEDLDVLAGSVGETVRVGKYTRADMLEVKTGVSTKSI